MTGKTRTPEEVQAALIYRSSGWTVAAIAEKLDVSVSTMERWLRTHKIKKGSIDLEAVEQAKAELKASVADNVKHDIAAVLSDDLASFRAARSALNEVLEQLMTDTSLPPHYRARGIVAVVTGMKLSSDMAHKSLNISGQQPEPEELPQLVVSELTADEIEEIKQNHFVRAGAFPSDETFNEASDYDDEIVEES